MEESAFVSKRIERVTMMRNKAIFMTSVLLFASLAFAAQHHSVEAGGSPELEWVTGDASQPLQQQELASFGLAPVFAAEPGVCSVEEGLFPKSPFVTDVALHCPLGLCGTIPCKKFTCGGGCAGRCDPFGCCDCDAC